jgi:alpha-L-fucosidase
MSNNKVTYSRTSPYFTTTTFGNNLLDVLNYRSFPAQADDVQYVIDRVYQYRPDLLAYDLYGDASLWWVFAARNPNTLKNPLGDFVPGVTISIPKQTTLASALGI